MVKMMANMMAKGRAKMLVMQFLLEAVFLYEYKGTRTLFN